MQHAHMFDSQAALGFVTSQRTHIESEVLKKPYPTIKYSRLIPVDTSANAFAASVTFFSTDSVGKAKFINGKGDDVPMVNLTGSKFEQTVNSAAIGYSFSFEEIGAAQQLGRNLSADGADAARGAYEQLVDAVAFTGDTDLGVEGLYNSTGISTAAAAGVFSGLTAQQVLGEINAVLSGIWEDSKGIELADTVVLPLGVYADIVTRQVSADSPMTILEFVQKANIYTAQTGQPLTIEGDHRLSGKMVAYRRDPQVLKLHMPMPLTFLPPQARGLQIDVPGMFRFSPVNIRRPGAVRYLTGV